MKINIETISHNKHRYPTVGDWWTKDDTLNIRVSYLEDWRYEYLIAIHELVEVMLCKNKGITEESVDNFDKSYKGEDEPGDQPNAPYQNEHNLATGIERILCASLGIKWFDYEQAIDRLFDEQ